MGGSPVALDPVIIPLVQGPKILDVGCGFGKWGALCTCNYWQTHAPVRGARPELTGCDGYEANVQMARKSGFYGQVLHLMVPPLPFDDRSFDTVLLIEILEHLTEDRGQALVQEAKRVARHRVILSTPNYPDFRDGVAGLTGWNALDAHRSYVPRSLLRRLGFRLSGCGMQPGHRYFRGLLRRLGLLGAYDNRCRRGFGSLSLLAPALADNIVGLWIRE